MTMYYAYLADLNKGVVSVIWGLNPLFIALFDFFLYKQKFAWRHLFGAISLIFCTIAIGISYFVEPTVPEDKKALWDWVHNLDKH